LAGGDGVTNRLFLGGDGGSDLTAVEAGECQVTVREDRGEVTRTLHTGDLVIVPQGCWHSNDAPIGVTMLFMTPREGNQHSWDDPAGHDD